nr:AraC family transcriptional regulator [Allomuricauda sp.]
MRTLRFQTDIELFAAGIGSAQSLFISVYSLLERKRDFRNILLSLFFLAVTIRLGKSILWVYLETTPQWLINLGFAAHAITGPALLLYLWHFLFPRRWHWLGLVHFIPAILLLLGLNALTQEGFWYAGGYHGLLFHQLGYSLAAMVLVCHKFWKKNPESHLAKTTILWVVALVAGTAVFQILYFTNYILGLTPYLLGPVVYLPFVYFMAFLLFKNPGLLQPKSEEKNSTAKLTNGELALASQKLMQLMETQKVYLDPNCSMAKVGQMVHMPSYLVSHVVNTHLGKSFPDFLNGYRIEAVKQKLLNPSYQHTKIASIAYECGFNTLSAFNAAFKKNTGTTPTQFQKSH